MSNIKIRRYTSADIEQCIVQVQQFLVEDRTNDGYENHYKNIDFDAKKVYKMLSQHVNDIDFFLNIITVDEEIVGGLCARVMSPFYSKDRIAYDQIFYITPEFKNLRAVMKLFKSYVEWASRRNVVECRMCSSTGFNQEGFTKLCQRLGFKQFEVGFSKGF